MLPAWHGTKQTDTKSRSTRSFERCLKQAVICRPAIKKRLLPDLRLTLWNAESEGKALALRAANIRIKPHHYYGMPVVAGKTQNTNFPTKGSGTRTPVGIAVWPA